MQELRSFVVAVLSGISAYLHPIAGNVFALVWLLGVNFIIGLFCGLWACHERFSWRKMWQFFHEAVTLFGIVAFVYIIGRLQGNQEGAVQCVSMIIYTSCYFYGVRILRNLRYMAKCGSPASGMLDFLYHVLSLEFTKKIPYLYQYIHDKGGATDAVDEGEKQ